MGGVGRLIARHGLGDLALVALLIALDVAARLLPHAPNVTPVAATALFAGARLRHASWSFAVPLLAMMLSDAVIGFYDWRVMGVVYLAMTLPALLGLMARRFEFPVVLLPLAAAGSVVFFGLSNFGVWAFGGMYAHSPAGLFECYVAAWPFFRNTLNGDVVWTAALLGVLGLAHRVPSVIARVKGPRNDGGDVRARNDGWLTESVSLMGKGRRFTGL